MHSPKILIFSKESEITRSAFGEYSRFLCRKLIVAGCNVEVVAPPKEWSWWRFGALSKFIQFHNPDTILLLYHGKFFPEVRITLLPFWVKFRFPQVRVVTQFESPVGVNFGAKNFLLRQLWRLLCGLIPMLDYKFGTLLSKSDAIICLAEKHRQTLLSTRNSIREKTIVLPPPALLKMASVRKERETREQIGVDQDSFLIVFYGFPYFSKGVEFLLEAFSNVAKDFPKARLLIIGEEFPSGVRTYTDQLKALSQRFGITDKIIWFGYHESDSDIASQMLYASDLAVLPFDDGVNLNNSSLSATAAHGLPIVTTIASPPDTAFSHKKNVYLVSPRSVPELTDAIRRLLSDEMLRKTLAKGALLLSEKTFSWQSQESHWMKTLLNSTTKTNIVGAASARE